MPRGFTALGLIALACVSATACSSSDDSHAAPIGSSGGSDGSSAAGGAGGAHHAGGSSGTGGSASHAGSSNTNGGDAGDENGSGGSADAGAGGDQPGTVVTVEPGACSETAKWASPVTLNGVSTAHEKLLSLTLDELDIAFSRDGALYRAHRAAASADFGTAAAVTLPTGYDASSGVALSNDGLTLIVVSTDGTAFSSVSRGTRDADFGATADDSAFAGLNARSVQTLEHYAAPVLSLDGKTLVFSGFTPGADGLAVVYESTLSNGIWSMPNNLSAQISDFDDGTGAKRKLPTGLSSDRRTLFYFDEGTGTEIARFRDRPDAPLYDHVDLGALAGAAPNAKCDRIYYTTADANLVTETD